MNSGTYKACSFIDINDDKKLNSDESIGNLIFSTNKYRPTVIDWQN
jgi:hypothetical protein